MDRKVLIIKTGFSEFLDRGISTTVSLGDVLNCTSLLHLYKKAHVTWVTSWGARQLVENNPYIGRLMIFGPDALKELAGESFDILINLEKEIGICSWMSQVKAKERYGFYFDPRIHDIATYRRSTRYLLNGQENHKNIHKTLLEILFETVGRKWKGEGPILHRPQRLKEIYDVGLNYAVGSKWPTKAWPIDKWKILETSLKKNHTVTWQKGHKNLLWYINWIDRCRLIVTGDSLGQIIGQALGKKVVTLFGPTNHHRMMGMPHITVIPSRLGCPHMPCYLPICKHSEFCMDFIPPEEVASVCERLLN
jgi:heptosyltransferase-2